MHSDLGAVWRAATDELADEIVSPQQRAYLRLTRLRAIVEDTALISVPDAFTRDVIESKLRPAITEALSRQLGRPIQVAVTVRPPDDLPAPNPATGAPAVLAPNYGAPDEPSYPSVDGGPAVPERPAARDDDGLFAMPDRFGGHRANPAPHRPSPPQHQTHHQPQHGLPQHGL